MQRTSKCYTRRRHHHQTTTSKTTIKLEHGTRSFPRFDIVAGTLKRAVLEECDRQREREGRDERLSEGQV